MTHGRTEELEEKIEELEVDLETLETKIESVHEMIQSLFLEADLCQTDEAKLKHWDDLLTDLKYLEWYARA